jgi:hypothetical protein
MNAFLNVGETEQRARLSLWLFAYLRVVESTCAGLVFDLNGDSIFLAGLEWRVLVVSVLVLALFAVADHERPRAALSFQLHPKRNPLSVVFLNVKLAKKSRKMRLIF